MKLSSHEEYGVRCLVQIARKGSVTIPEISEAEGISQPYAAKLLRTLRQSGYIASLRGKDGGYKLAKTAESIIVGDVLAALGGRMFDTAFCESHAGQAHVCAHTSDCSIRTLWRRVQDALDEVLGKTTLQDLLRTEEQMTGWFDLPQPAVAEKPAPARR